MAYHNRVARCQLSAAVSLADLLAVTAAGQTSAGKPNLNGIWQAVNTANWDIQTHGPSPGPPAVGAIGVIPPGLEWMGDSRGHWEGNTLVVETTNLQVGDRSRFGVQYDGMTDKNLHITERFTRTSPDSILYRATIDDPTVYIRPWTMGVLLDKSEGPVFEYACHEGNYGLAGVLAGERAQEKRAAEHKGTNR